MKTRNRSHFLSACLTVTSLTAACLTVACLLPTSPAQAESIPIFVSGQDRPYELLDTTRPVLETVRGPGELRIVSRARFKPNTPDRLRYSLMLRIDGGEPMEIRYDNVKRSRTAMFRDGTLGVPGRLMDYRVDLGRGYHNIEILPGPNNPPIFYRVLFEPRRAQKRNWVAMTPIGGSELVELVVRERLYAYYRNPVGQGFTIDVIGPTELRVFTRTENTPEMRGRIHYRIQVLADGDVINTFQLSSRRSQITTYHKEDSLVPGTAAEIVIPVGSGRHRLELVPLDPDKSTLLARFMLPREDLALTSE